MSTGGIVLAAHGCGDASNVNRRVRAIAASVARRTGRPVVAGFNLGTPSWAEAIDAIDADRVVVAPLMMSEGYFSGTVLPERCAGARTAGSKRLAFAAPIGIRPELAAGIVGRCAKAVEEFGVDPARATVLVVGHGTRRNPESGRSTSDLADSIRDRIGGVRSVAVFLDQDPLLEDVAGTLATRDVIVVPHLLGGGDHAERDVAERLGLRVDGSPPRAVYREGGRVRRYIFEPPLLDAPGLVDAIVATIEGEERPAPIRLGTRRSALALWQAERVREAIEGATGRAVRLVEFDASGDLDLTAPIEALPGAAPFTDSIAAALEAGEIDLATHSLKDLPLEPDPRLPVVGVLERGPTDEVLIAREGHTLDTLPAGARIGVSCARRTGQLLRMRPDLEPATIRGPVDRRVAMVLDGTYDGAILAAAGVERLGLGYCITQRFGIDEITPAPGQGAIALQARAGDAEMRCVGALVEDGPTRRCVEAELGAARVLEPIVEPMSVAAWARVAEAGAIELFVRVVSRDGQFRRDERLRGHDPRELAEEASRRVLGAIGHVHSMEGAS